MPPKKKVDGPSKKTEMKKKEKVVEDKTFGLKNKKGTKQQKFIQHVQKQTFDGGKKNREIEKEKTDKLTAAEKKKAAKEELNLLFRPVQEIKKGVDPKSVLCAFFKAGSCTKGDKCKFSHDLTIGRKAEKRSMYDDGKEGEKEENMEDWDEAQLAEVVAKKHGASNKQKMQTAIICKFFLDAVENNKYGWFWQCPTGDQCHYKHALPPGFVLKKDKKKMDEMKVIVSLEELIEKERAALSSKNLTKVTLESFLKWKERKKKEKKAAHRAASDKKKTDYKAGKAFGISGREMFEFNPDLMDGDDDEASDMKMYHEPEEEALEEDDVAVKEINLDDLTSYIGGESPAAPAPGPAERGMEAEEDKSDQAAAAVPNDRDEPNKLDIAGALPLNPQVETDAAIAAAIAATIDGTEIVDTPIDENLFDGEDLDMIEDELDTLDLED